MIPATITPRSINVLIDGRMRTVTETNMNFHAIRDLFRDLNAGVITEQEAIGDLRDFLDIPVFLARITEGRVQISDDAVLFDGQPVGGIIATRLLELLREGFDVRPLSRFLERVSTNPIKTACDEIYLWLESGNLPLTEDGCFLAFKKVKSDYSSSHQGPDGKPFYNHIGTSPSMPREEVDDDRNNTCSRGLHFCSYQYLPQFGLGGESKVVIVKVAPENVVSIPTDYNHSKGRAWTYTIIGELPESECEHFFANKPVVDNFGLYDDRDFEEEEGEDKNENDAIDAELDGYGCNCCNEETEEADNDCFNVCNDRCEGVDPDCPLIDKEAEAAVCDPKVTPDAPTEVQFKHGNKTFDGAEVKHLCAEYGQRGFSRMTGVPRTTLQGWLEKIG